MPRNQERPSLPELLATLDSSLLGGLGVSILCGGLIGLERQVLGKPIGIRTSILICVGTQVFVWLGVVLASEGGDPSRVLGQVVTGIGFLGAGVILARGGTITGVTSAAVVWILAGIGATVGAGRPNEAIALALVAIAILIGVRLIERVFKRLAQSPDEPDP